ncbi:forkhead box protein D3-like [Ceratitis capitata]|uniref:forkhead box protein D3-like n=1 Tax=Ceratitis capitata TaxID=7213 RepID=UPI0003297FEC|nr:forkhead box protein D3-like [Ceratitis capitata]
MAPITDFSIDALLSNETGAQAAAQPAAQKPGYTFPQMITMAIERSPQQKLKLCDITKWITENFPYYQKDQPSWQNQVRHTLTTSNNFSRIKREAGEPGRGDYWAMTSTINQQQQNAPHSGPGLNGLPTEAIAHGIAMSHPDAFLAVYFPTAMDIQQAQQYHYYQQQFMATAQCPNMTNYLQ